MSLQLSKRKGQAVSNTAMAIIVAIVVLFVGLFMISEVASVASINNTSDFYSVYDSLVTNTSTIYSILVLVLIVVGLAVAIAYLRGFGGQAGGTAV